MMEKPMTESARTEVEEAAASVSVQMVPPVALDGIWHEIETLLGPLLDEYPFETLDDVRASIEAAHRQLWVVLRAGEIAAVAVTQIAVFPRARVMELVFLAGEQIVDIIPKLDEWLCEVARHAACSTVQIYGRDGWTKHFKKVGGHRAAIVYRKELG